MRTIWKFPFDDRGSEVTLLMPKDAEVLTVQVQRDRDGREQMCLWALVESTNKPEERVFALVATGDPYERDASSYLGTYQLDGGRDVGHIFEVT